MQYKIHLRTALLAMALVAIAGIPVTARALGLGQLQSDTRIGQPFSARIPITGASASVLQGLHVELAGADAYKNANLNQPDYLYTLKFSVEQGSKGAYIKVSSDKPVKLPFLNLLINARWNSGQVTRQYTVLLNPPVFVAGSQSQQPVNAPSSPAQAQQSAPAQTPQPAAAPQPAPSPKPTQSQPTQQPVQPTQTMPASESPTSEQQQQQPPPPPPQQQQQQQQTTSSQAPGTYTVRHGDTLWGLSRQMRPSSGVSVNQMMIALYRANPHAFQGNINRLNAGAVLQIPSQSEIARITADEATRIVARQNNDWQGEQTSTQVARSNAAAGAQGGSQTGQGAESQGKGTETASQSKAGEQQQAAAPGTAGRVVLTTPEVTATTSAAAAPGSAVASGTASSAAISGAVASSPGSSGQASAKSGEVAGTGASVGGPLKVKSNAMAGLAGAGTSGAAEAGTKASPKASAAAPAKKRPQPSKVSNAANNVNSVTTAGSEESEAGNRLMYWIQQPTGWIVIGAVILLLLALLMFIVRRRKSGTGQGGQVPLVETGEGEGQEEASGHTEEGSPHEADGGKENAGESGAAASGDELGIATYIGGPSLDVNKVDAIDEAELHAGFGDYAKGAEVLREAIERNPSRVQLRRKLLDVLFAAGDAAGFASEATLYREQADEAEWKDVAVMGRQLLPEDELFASASAAAEAAAPSDIDGEDATDDYLDIDLDRLSADTEGGSDQTEFERTMDELSTFIETYVPASTDTPVSLQLPPEEEQARAQPKADEPVELPEDVPLEFTLDDDDFPAPRDDTDADSELAIGEEDEGENLVDTKLDLARAYIDMGDSDSARSVLEEVIDEGDDTQSGEARRLLESLS